METYLAHHGIIGMKWGVRRYQNPDGTLTSAGKKHIAKSQKNRKEAGGFVKLIGNDIKKSDKKLGKIVTDVGSAIETRGNEISRYRDRDIAKKAKTMSDDELRKAVTRMNLERQYRSLTKEDMDAGSDFVYSKSKETVKDVIAYSAPIVSAIVVPIIAAKVTQKINK